MITINVEVPPAKHQTDVIAKTVKEVLETMIPELDWSVHVNQSVEHEIHVSIMSVN